MVGAKEKNALSFPQIRPIVSSKLKLLFKRLKEKKTRRKEEKENSTKYPSIRSFSSSFPVFLHLFSKNGERKGKNRKAKSVKSPTRSWLLEPLLLEELTYLKIVSSFSISSYFSFTSNKFFIIKVILTVKTYCTKSICIYTKLYRPYPLNTLKYKEESLVLVLTVSFLFPLFCPKSLTSCSKNYQVYKELS